MKDVDIDCLLFLVPTLIGRAMVAGREFFRRKFKNIILVMSHRENLNKNITEG